MTHKVKMDEFLEGCVIACCNDGTRPVVFKLERIDEA